MNLFSEKKWVYWVLSLICINLIYYNGIWLLGIPLLVIIGGYVYKENYFNSEYFLKFKSEITDHVNDCNDFNFYIEQLKHKQIGFNPTFDSNVKTTTIDNSAYNFRREYWNNFERDIRVLDCSLQVLRNFRIEPIKYLFKYFKLSTDENTLNKFETLLNDQLSIEQGRLMLLNKRKNILDAINNSVPFWIKTFHNGELINRLNFLPIDLNEQHVPFYSFRYISPGGNKHEEEQFDLTVKNIESIIYFINDKITQSKTVKYQRALMTNNLRKEIKIRDNHTCKCCGNSQHKEPNLLLEIDHIIPVSKGGLTKLENLQTLCWKCNRSKGNKVN